jgi:hypothetical protein
MGIKVALEHRTSYTFDRLVEVHPHVTGFNLREKQARQSTDVGAPGILDLRRVRTVLR